MKKILTTILILAIFFSISPVKALPSEETKIIGSGLSSGEFLSPKGVSVDEKGNIYVLDSGNYRVQVFDNNGNFKFMFGGKGTGPFQFMQPLDIAVKNEKVYITDGYGDIPFSNKVVVYDTKGKFLYKFGERGSEKGNFMAPTGIAIDEERYVYICDTGNRRVEKFTESGQLVKTFGEGVLDSPIGIDAKNGKVFVSDFYHKKIFIFSYDGKLSKNLVYSEFKSPGELAVDDNGNIFVVESGLASCGIFMFDSNGKFLKKIGNYGIKGGEFLKPYGIFISNEKIFITDEITSKLQILTKEGKFIWEIRSILYRPDSMYLPTDILVSDKKIFIVDSMNWRVLILDENGSFAGTIEDIEGFPEWKLKPGVDLWFEIPFIIYPICIQKTKEGNFLVGDFGRFKYAFGGSNELMTPAHFRFLLIRSDGSYINSFSDDSKYPIIYNFVINDETGEIYANDGFNILVLDSRGKFLRKMNFAEFDVWKILSLTLDSNKNLLLSFMDGKVLSFTKDRKFIENIGIAGEGLGELKNPEEVAEDNGNYYVCDSGNSRIQIFDKFGNFIKTFGKRGTKKGEFIHPIRISISDDKIYVLDDYACRVSVFDKLTKDEIFSAGESGIQYGKLLLPTSIAVASSGEIFVLDSSVGLVHKFNPDGIPIFNFGMTFDISRRFSLSAIFPFTGKISIDKEDNIYATDVYDNLIYKFDKFGNLLGFLYCGDYGIKSPFGICIGKDEKLYVTDESLSKIFVFDKDSGGLLFSFGSNDGETILNSPWGVAADEEGNIYVADSGNIAVKFFDKNGNLKKEIPIQCDFSEPPFTPTDIFYYEGYLYVLDSYNHKIILMNKNGETVATFGQKGGPATNFYGFNGTDFYQKDYGEFLYPLGIFVRDKKIYVADTSNSRVQVIPLSIFFDIIPPKISVQNSPERFINENSFNITFKVSDDRTPQDKINIYININGNGFNKISSGDTLRLINLSEGPCRIFAKAVDPAENESDPIKIEFIVDLTPPEINFNLSGSTENNKVTLNGSVSDGLSGVKEAKINGNTVKIENNSSFSADLNLNPGLNEIVVEAVDSAGNKTSKSANIYRKVTMVLKVGQNKFTVNGVEESLDAPSIIKNGRTLVPMRVIIEALGGTVIWEDLNKKIIILLKDEKIELWVGKNIAVINGVMRLIDYLNPDIVPEIINGRTMLPVRFVATNLGFNVQWDNATKTITINN